MAAKWPPRSNSDQWTTLWSRSASLRMATSWVRDTATPVGTVPRSGAPNMLGSW